MKTTKTMNNCAGACMLPNRIIQVDGVNITSPYSIEEESSMTPEEIDKITEYAIKNYRKSHKASKS